MFAITIESDSDTDVALGRIQIDDFSERFTLDTAGLDAEVYERLWRQQLRTLLEGRPIVTLPAWTGPPDRNAPRRAWVLYREGDAVFVQDRLYVAESVPITVDPDGSILDVAPRETVTEDGERISEWRTSVGDISRFLDRRR